MLFFFDETKRDLSISIFKEEWANLDEAVWRMCNKYSALHLSPGNLYKLIKRCRGYPEESVYSLDFVTNVCCICLSHDPREKASPFPWDLSYISDPQKMAEMIFNLNLCQAQDEKFRKELLGQSDGEKFLFQQRASKKLVFLKTKSKVGRFCITQQQLAQR